jgi:cohesin loading factor subunit SCC2
LIVRLTDATEQEEFDSLSHIRAISLLCAGQPAIIDTAKATVLLTYLRPPSKVSRLTVSRLITQADDREANDLLLRIFRLSIPHMPRAASNFATDLTKALLPMISKPSGGLSVRRPCIDHALTLSGAQGDHWLFLRRHDVPDKGLYPPRHRVEGL